MIEECSIDAIYNHIIKENVPLSVLFELTYRCNLRCNHCYIVDRGEKELSFSEIADILDQLVAQNCLFLTFSGGEVLVRDDFLDIARYAQNRGFVLKIFSNGNLIDKSMARELAILKPLEIGISIYSADAVTHDKCTGVPGSFERSFHALRLLKEQGVPTVVKYLLMKENVNQLEETRELTKEVGAIFQFDPIITPRNDGNRDPQQHQLDEADLYRIFSRESYEPQVKKERLSQISDSVICGAGRSLCSISPGGIVHPCVAMPMPLGNLREQNFTKIWHGTKIKELRNFRFSDLYQCVTCDYLDYCMRCWGLAVVESGEYLGPAYSNCRVARIRHRISVECSKNKLTGGYCDASI